MIDSAKVSGTTSLSSSNGTLWITFISVWKEVSKFRNVFGPRLGKYSNGTCCRYAGRSFGFPVSPASSLIRSNTPFIIFFEPQLEHDESFMAAGVKHFPHTVV